MQSVDPGICASHYIDCGNRAAAACVVRGRKSGTAEKSKTFWGKLRD